MAGRRSAAELVELAQEGTRPGDAGCGLHVLGQSTVGRDDHRPGIDPRYGIRVARGRQVAHQLTDPVVGGIPAAAAGVQHRHPVVIALGQIRICDIEDEDDGLGPVAGQALEAPQ